jgi:hypothetical protein
MRDSYKRFVKTWIRFANPWIRIVSWPRFLTLKKFDSYPTIQILDSYRIVDRENKNLKLLDSFRKDSYTNPASLNITQKVGGTQIKQKVKIHFSNQMQ